MGSRERKEKLRKHRVAFREAATVFRDPLAITIYDPDHSHDEDRYIPIGISAPGRLLMVAHEPRRPNSHHQCARTHPHGA